MGQRHALWNLGLNGLPAVGLFGAAGTLVARRYPMTFFSGAGAICAVGLACITAAKLTVIRNAHLTSFGSERHLVMRRTGLSLLLTMMSVSVVWAQQDGAAPGAIAPKLDTPQVRVIVATLQPRMPAIAANGHATDRVLVYLDNGSMTHTEGGRTTTIDFHRGDVRWRAASGPYISENTSDHPIRILEVDLKGPPAGPAVKSALDAVAVDPKHFTVQFENDAVRVLRVHYDAHDKSQNHEHVLNRVILYLNDSVIGKMDEVRASAPRIHVEENDSDQPADAIAVELK